VSHQVKQLLAQKLIIEIEHPPSSPDLALNDFWHFSKIKSALKGWRFQDIEDIQKKNDAALIALPQQEFQKCSQQWQHHWAKCMAVQGECFEGDPSQQAAETKEVCLHQTYNVTGYVYELLLFTSCLCGDVSGK
jgi:hypothetical protein